MKNPLVSICIPTYNGSEFIEEALNSAIKQTYSNIEIIVSDDNSIDTTVSIVESSKKNTNTPISIYHHRPQGIGANWNYCIKVAKGEFIKLLFQDDILNPSCIEEMVNQLILDKTIGIIASKREIIYKKEYNPEVVNKWLSRFQDLQIGMNFETNGNLIYIDKSLFKSKQFLRTPINKIGEPSVIMFRKELVAKVGYYRTDLSQILDYEFCYRVLKTHKIAIINKPLVKFRLHENQATNKNTDIGDYDKFSKILYQEYLNYVDDYTKKHLLKKHNIVYKLYYALKARINKYFWKFII